MPCTNQFGQFVGDPVPNWQGCPPPGDVILIGRTCRLERLNVEKHCDDLFEANSYSDPQDYTYSRVGLFTNVDEHRKWIESAEKTLDPLQYAVINLATNKAVGTISLRWIDTTNGNIEVGNLRFYASLKRSTLSTEAQYLLMAYVFDQLGYRRYEWKCDTFNVPSRNAAERLGFKFEGIFRKQSIIDGRSRDLAAFSIIDDEWPAIERAFQKWLAPENFNGQGQQVKSLKECREN